MAELFISYRRTDAAWAAGRIGDRLSQDIGADRVFLDTVIIEPGADFVETIGDHVEECRALLAIIGPNWAEELSVRAGQANDFVRIEISQAIRRGIRVIPIVLDDTNIPSATDLPRELSSLTARNAVRVRADMFESDMSHFVSFLKDFLGTVGLQANLQAQSHSPAISSTPLTLKHRTEYWKIGKNGREWRKIYVSLDAPDEITERVEKVVHRLSSTFKNPVREIFDRDSGFELRTNGYGGFDIQALVHFADGTQSSWLNHRVTFD